MNQALFGDDLPFHQVDLPPWAATSREDAIKFLVNELVKKASIRPENAERVVSQLLEREALGPTAIGRGVAIPHAASDVVADLAGVIGRAAVPIPWEKALDGKPVAWVVLLVQPVDRPGAILRALEKLSRRLRGEGPS